MTIDNCGCDETYCDKHFKEMSEKMRKEYDREKQHMRYCPECSRPMKLTGFTNDKLGIYECEWCGTGTDEIITDDHVLFWSDVDPSRRRA